MPQTTQPPVATQELPPKNESLEVAPESQPKSVEKASSREPEIMRGVGGELKAKLELGNGAEAVVKPLVVENFLSGRSNAVKEGGKKVAENAVNALKGDDTESAKEMMAQQIQEEQIESSETAALAGAVGEVPNVYAIDTSSLDTARLGDKMNFTDQLTFGIDPNNADQMLDLLSNPHLGVGELAGKFDLKKNSPLDRATEGFEVVYQHTTPQGVEVRGEVTFLYLQMKESAQPPTSEQKKDPTAAEKTATQETVGQEKTPQEEVDISQIQNDVDRKRAERAALKAKENSSRTVTPTETATSSVNEKIEEQKAPVHNVSKYRKNVAATKNENPVEDADLAKAA